MLSASYVAMPQSSDGRFEAIADLDAPLPQIIGLASEKIDDFNIRAIHRDQVCLTDVDFYQPKVIESNSHLAQGKLNIFWENSDVIPSFEKRIRYGLENQLASFDIGHRVYGRPQQAALHYPSFVGKQASCKVQFQEVAVSYALVCCGVVLAIKIDFSHCGAVSQRGSAIDNERSSDAQECRQQRLPLTNRESLWVDCDRCDHDRCENQQANCNCIVLKHAAILPVADRAVEWASGQGLRDTEWASHERTSR